MNAIYGNFDYFSLFEYVDISVNSELNLIINELASIEIRFKEKEKDKLKVPLHDWLKDKNL